MTASVPVTVTRRVYKRGCECTVGTYSRLPITPQLQVCENIGVKTMYLQMGALRAGRFVTWCRGGAIAQHSAWEKVWVGLERVP